VDSVLRYINEGAFEDEEETVWVSPPGTICPLDFQLGDDHSKADGLNNSSNKLFVRKSWKHLVEIMNHVANAGVIDGLIYKQVIVEGPPGDGKVSTVLLLRLQINDSPNSLLF
jgi:hypothetical protein